MIVPALRVALLCRGDGGNGRTVAAAVVDLLQHDGSGGQRADEALLIDVGDIDGPTAGILGVDCGGIGIRCGTVDVHTVLLPLVLVVSDCGRSIGIP